MLSPQLESVAVMTETYSDDSPDQWAVPQVTHSESSVARNTDLIPNTPDSNNRRHSIHPDKPPTSAWAGKNGGQENKSNGGFPCFMWLLLLLLCSLLCFLLGMLLESKFIHLFEEECQTGPVAMRDGIGQRRPFTYPAPYCPNTVSMIGSSGQKYSRPGALQIATTDTYDCRDLCQRVQSCMHATYEPTANGATHGVCYVELTDQMDCQIPIADVQAREERKCQGTHYCTSWHKDCFCPTVVDQDRQLTAQTYLEQMAFALICNQTINSPVYLNPSDYLDSVCYEDLSV